MIGPLSLAVMKAAITHSAPTHPRWVIITLVLVALGLGSHAGAQSFSVWAAVMGSTNPLRGTLAAGLGSNLPLGLGSLGVEIELGQTTDTYSLRGAAAVLRDLSLPLLPISVYAKAGVEQYGLRGNFDTAPVVVHVGGGLRYAVLGPFGVMVGVRSYLIGTPPGAGTLSIQAGFDLKF
jgi:hypothetical protein